MAGRGRGRGRGLLNLDKASIPGGLNSDTKTETAAPPPENTADVAEDAKTGSAGSPSREAATLSEKDIQAILSDSRTYSDQYDVKKVLVLAQNFVRTEKDIKSVACAIYSKCMEDSSLAKRGAEICDNLTVLEVGNVKFRNTLLSLVQADYKARKEIHASSPSHFNGFLAFLCEVFSVMRTNTGEVFKPLVPAIFDCLGLVLGDDSDDAANGEDGGNEDEDSSKPLDSSLDDDACDVFALHLPLIGRLLDQNAENRMRSLMNRVRTCIIHSRSSPRARCSLLEVLEAYTRSWEPAPNDITKFYCDMAVNIISGVLL